MKSSVENHLGDIRMLLRYSSSASKIKARVVNVFEDILAPRWKFADMSFDVIEQLMNKYKNT
jgi:hypothetical protein